MKIVKILKSYNKVGLIGVFHKIKRKFYKKSYEYSIKIDSLEYDLDEVFHLEEINSKLLAEMYMKYKNEITLRKYNLITSRMNKESTERSYVVVDLKNEIYGYYHVSYDEYDRTKNTKSILNNQRNAYLFDDYTFIERRGQGAHKYSIITRLANAKSLGCETANVHIEVGNTFSQRAYETFGFQKINVIRNYKIFGLKKTIKRTL